DHPYKVFFPDWDLQKLVAQNIARFINQTGADQMDFDGHEGTFATGMGDLSFNTFAEDVFRLTDHPVVFGSSRDNHYFWHFNDYLNWGEPWYGSFRQSQTDTRIANQKFYEDNYLPNMLGWFLITAQTSPEDVEWMLARAAGYGAGYALVLRKDALSNPALQRITKLIGLWTAAQRKKMFDPEQKAWLRDVNNEARLLSTDGVCYLQRVRKVSFTYDARVLQPGQPTSQSWDLENPVSAQVPVIVVSAQGDDGHIKSAVFDIDNSFHLPIPVPLYAGQSLVLNDNGFARLYDKKGRLIKQITLDQNLPLWNVGRHTLTFDGPTDDNSPVTLKIDVKLADKNEALGRLN
ncbi:MAG TPA: hypothetical protein VGS79_23260, partial [Puia sp.]|nr:hypothetical protein [Puia sp.]